MAHHQRRIERCVIWARVCHLYIRKAPGSSAKPAMLPDSRASSAKSSRSSSSFCCCHGSMPSQMLEAAPHTEIDFSHEPGLLLWSKWALLLLLCCSCSISLYNNWATTSYLTSTRKRTSGRLTQPQAWPLTPGTWPWHTMLYKPSDASLRR